MAATIDAPANRILQNVMCFLQEEERSMLKFNPGREKGQGTCVESGRAFLVSHTRTLSSDTLSLLSTIITDDSHPVFYTILVHNTNSRNNLCIS